MARITRIKNLQGNNHTFEELLTEFIDSRRVRNLKQATIKSYDRNSQPFRLFLEEQGIEHIEILQKKDIDQFIKWLQDKYNNTATINSYLRAVRAMLNFAMEEEQGYLNPFKIRLPKEDKKIGAIYSAEDIQKLIRKPDFKKCSDWEYKAWVMVNYFLETGNRVSTVNNIKVKDVDFTLRQVTLTHTKNRQEAFSPISPAVVKILKLYIKEFKLQDDGYLFPNVNGRQMSVSGMEHTITKFNRSRGVEITSCHAFRRTFASNYIIKGGEVFSLQRLLGHSSLEMTMRYVNLHSKDYTRNFENFSLIEQFSNEHKIKRTR
jgi:integrase/recombinase XerD